MILLFKALLIVAMFTFIYFWNRYVPKWMIGTGTTFHKTYNSKNLKRQPIKFVVENEETIVKYIKGFYWIGFITFVVFILSY